MTGDNSFYLPEGCQLRNQLFEWILKLANRFRDNIKTTHCPTSLPPWISNMHIESGKNPPPACFESYEAAPELV